MVCRLPEPNRTEPSGTESNRIKSNIRPVNRLSHFSRSALHRSEPNKANKDFCIFNFVRQSIFSDAVTTEQVPGKTREEFGKLMKSSPTLGSAFQIFWAEVNKYEYKFPSSYTTLSSVSNFVFLGANNDHMLPTFLLLNPKLKFILLHKTLKKEDFKNKDLPLDQIEIRDGDVLDVKTLPKEQDIYYAHYVCHEHKDDKLLEILKNIREAIGTHKSKLLIGEWLPEVGKNDLVGLGADLWMMRFGNGVIRSSGQFETVLKQAGFKLVTVVNSNIPHLLKVLEAEPV